MLRTSMTTIASTFVLQKKIIYSFFPLIFKQTVKKGGISTEGLGQLEDFQISDKPVLAKFWTFFLLNER